MNIRDNIVNYLFDRNYVVSMYDDCVYFFNYKYLDSFDDKEIIVSLVDRKITLIGHDMSITKMTKEELLIRGKVSELKVIVR